MKKKVNIAYTQKFIDFQGKQHDVLHNLSFTLTKDKINDVWTSKFPNEILENLIDLGKRYGLNITTEE